MARATLFRDLSFYCCQGRGDSCTASVGSSGKTSLFYVLKSRLLFSGFEYPSILPSFQVEDTRFVFEARTLQRMELLVLSTLDWKMNPITPLSFVDHMVRRMASENRKNKPQHWKFQKMCHSTLLSVIAGREIDLKQGFFYIAYLYFFPFHADSRWLEYLPSVLAAATMLHVLDQMEEESRRDQIISLLDTNQVGSSFDQRNRVIFNITNVRLICRRISGRSQSMLRIRSWNHFHV